MKNFTDLEVWFFVGSQHLYGDEILSHVSDHSAEITKVFNESNLVPINVIFKGLGTNSDEINKIVGLANTEDNCVGIIFWMHTFSPGKMWIEGLSNLQKPFLHLHTQFNERLPWDTIDMDFMNENQSAHGDREFGFICSRLQLRRKVVSGHYLDKELHLRLGKWTRVAVGVSALRKLKVARIGDNMREVAVTEGDKVEAQRIFGYSVNGYGVGDLTDVITTVSELDIRSQLELYRSTYEISEEVLKSKSLYEAGRIELGLEKFLEGVGALAFTDTFENLHGLDQLPGLAVQRLMNKGYGFGAEGDWKTAAMLYATKFMTLGMNGGSSFMEDYTYDFSNTEGKVLGAHMLEICPSIAESTPHLEVHPLDIGGKNEPARLVFNVEQQEAVNFSIVDLGNRFRVISNQVITETISDNPKELPVARAFWRPLPDFRTSSESWIYSGGSHHTVFSQSLDLEMLNDFCEILGVELISITEESTVSQIKQTLKWNQQYYNHQNT